MAFPWLAAAVVGGAFLQRQGAAQGAQARADMLYQQGVQNTDNIYEMRNKNYANLGAMKEGMNFQRTAGPQQMKLAKDWNLFKEGELGKERARTIADATRRMTDVELSPEATELRKRKNLESLQTQLALRADDANRKWGFVPSRTQFGFGGF